MVNSQGGRYGDALHGQPSPGTPCRHGVLGAVDLGLVEIVSAVLVKQARERGHCTIGDVQDSNRYTPHQLLAPDMVLRASN